MSLTLTLSILAIGLLAGNILIVYLDKKPVKKPKPITNIRNEKKLDLIDSRLNSLEKLIIKNNQPIQNPHKL